MDGACLAPRGWKATSQRSLGKYYSMRCEYDYTFETRAGAH